VDGADVLGRLVGLPVALLWSTLKVDKLHRERYAALKTRGERAVFSLWHGRMLVPILCHRRQGIVTMASQSKDGQVIARWLERNGYVVVRGSSSRGGGPALREAVRMMRSGRDGALTVDGPQGPPRVVQPGVVALARLADAAILPISYACARPRFLASWDRYLLPTPFSRVVVSYGETFKIPPEMSGEEALRQIAEALDAATREADAAVGVQPPPPWSV
jgi:lysophospholipid acyltransferase (LPLAT)-like uncharacterized protein